MTTDAFLICAVQPQEDAKAAGFPPVCVSVCVCELIASYSLT